MQFQTKEHINTYHRSAIPGFDALFEIALNLSWSWSHSSDKIWSQLDQNLWEATRNPWVVLQTVSREKLEAVLLDQNFRDMVDACLEANRKTESAPAWFQKTFNTAPFSCAAYFSMEFMLCEALPIYSGGLGNVAGDQLKAASDLGIPVVGIGLLYQKGYFRQMIDGNGNQQALYPFNDPGQLPITPLRKANGEWLRLELSLPGYSIWIRAWQVKVGRAKLFLLDSNDAANFPIYRGITSELYGGGTELRLQQELLLGIGGWRLLEELGIKPDVCHLNEGHAAFAVLERAKNFMKEKDISFEKALDVSRAGNLFTTHTAVSAGFDRFYPLMIQKYLGKYAHDHLGLSTSELLALGRLNPNDSSEYFNVAYLAIRGSGTINGVSRLHGEVSRKIFQPLFPHWPQSQVPIRHVTNGVHMPSWDSVASDELWTNICGKARWLEETECLEKAICSAPIEKIWSMRNANRKQLVEYSRERLSTQLAASGANSEEIDQAKHIFDPSILTLGFARRFATYKRPNMLLYDKGRLLKILTNPSRPVQLIVSGKAHPADMPGQAMIREWINFIKWPEARPHVIFLSDYDMQLTEHLVQGVDVWINTPRRPWEACGTSGMKVLVNGGLNLSEVDGWWAEAYRPEVGWAIGDGKEHGEDPAWDAAEANALYDLLENQIVPEFYARDSEGRPAAWLNRVQVSMARLTPYYSANRAVRDYARLYVNAALKYRQRTENPQWIANVEIWKKELDQKWGVIRFSEYHCQTTEGCHHFTVQVYLDNISPSFVNVELYSDPQQGEDPFIQKMDLVRPLAGAENTYLFEIKVPSTRSATDFTARVVPYLEGVSIPLECSHILWQK